MFATLISKSSSSMYLSFATILKTGCLKKGSSTLALPPSPELASQCQCLVFCFFNWPVSWLYCGFYWLYCFLWDCIHYWFWISYALTFFPLLLMTLTSFSPAFLLAFWLTTECQSQAYAIMICLLLSLLSLLLSVSTPPDHMLGQNKVHTLHAHAAISCIVAHQKLYHSDLYLLYSSHICMFILMSIVHKVINIATSNLTGTCI